MPKKAEFRFYQIPNGEDVLALLGGNWIRESGKSGMVWTGTRGNICRQILWG